MVELANYFSKKDEVTVSIVLYGTLNLVYDIHEVRKIEIVEIIKTLAIYILNSPKKYYLIQ